MALPKDETSLDEYFDDLLFTGAICSATKGLVPQGKRVLAARAGVEIAVTAKNKQRDAVVLANVAQDIAWEALRLLLESYERQVDAHFDTDRKAYGKVFPQTVPALTRVAEGARAETLKPVITFASQPRQTGKLGETGKAFLQGWQEYAAAGAVVATAAAALATGIEAIGDAKHQGVVVMRDVDGATRSKYADDPKQARRFFRSKGTGKVDLEAEAKRLEAVAAKAIAAAQEARARADKAKAAAEAEQAANGETTGSGSAGNAEPRKARG